MKEKSIQQQYQEFRKGFEPEIVHDEKENIKIFLTENSLISRTDLMHIFNLTFNDIQKIEYNNKLNRVIAEKGEEKRVFYYIREIAPLVNIS